MHLAAPTRAFPQASSALASTSPCAGQGHRGPARRLRLPHRRRFQQPLRCLEQHREPARIPTCQPPGRRRSPYGHGRYEYLAGLFVAVLVCAVGINLILESVTKIIKPSPTAYSVLSLAALVLSMLVKLWMAAFNRTLGDRIDSETLIATAQDSKNDVITSGSVLVAVLISQTTGFDLDGWAGLGVGIFICISGMGLCATPSARCWGKRPTPSSSRNPRQDYVVPQVLGTRPHGARLRPRSSVCQRPRGDARRGRRI